MNLFKRIKNRLKKTKLATPSRKFFPTTQGGIYVDHDTAMNFSAVFAAVRYVAETVAGLPWHVYRRQADGGKKLALTHTLDRLLHLRPNPELSAFSFKTTMCAWAQTWGNAYAEIEKDAAGRIAALWPISPDRVEPRRNEDGQLYYEINNHRGPKSILKPGEIFHLAGMGFDGIRGYSIVSLAATSIGAGLASDKFVASFYANGAVLSGALTHPKQLTDEGFARLKEDFKEQYTGSQKAWKPIILEDGTKWESFGMPLKDAEFLASQKYRVTDIARWFRVPPHKIADLERATFTNIEHQSIEVVQDTILPWTLRAEQEADYKLISSRNYSLYYTKMNLNSMMRGDHENRAKYYKAMKEGGNMNTNEIRGLEDLNPIGKVGDKYFMQSQYTTLEKIGEEVKPAPAKPVEDPDDPDKDKDDMDLEIKSQYGAILNQLTGRILRRENLRFDTIIKEDKPAAYFNEWTDRFFDEHEKYMYKTLEPSVRCVTVHFNVGFTSTILKNFINHHITNRKANFKDTHPNPRIETNEKEVAAYMTDNLVKQIIFFAKKEIEK